MRKAMNDGADTVKARVRKVRKQEAGQGDMAAWSIGGGKRGAMMAGWRRAWVADSAGQSWASTFSRFRYTQTAVSLAAILLPRDARTVVSLNANRPEIVEAQLPLADHSRDHQEVAGSLPPPSNVSVGPYTSCSISTVSHESFDRVAPGPWCRDPHTSRLSYAARELDEPRWPLVSPVPSHRNDPGARYNMAPPPTPSQGRGTLAVNVLTLSSSSSPTITISCRETGQASRHRSSPSLTMEVTTDA